MTIQQLSQLYFLSKEIDFLKSRIEELSFLSAISYDNEIRGGGVSDPTSKYVSKRIELLKDLKSYLIKREEEEKKLLDYIKKINDGEIRVIMELRFIAGMSWSDIAKKLSPDDKLMDESSFRKKISNFLQ